MEAIRQVYEKLPEVITTPPEMRDQCVEVIIAPLLREQTVEEIAAELGMKPEEILDPGILKFAGCMPDFPPRELHEGYETRLELE